MSMAYAGATGTGSFRVGNVLQQAIGVMSRHFVLFFLVAAFTQLPQFLLGLSAATSRVRPVGHAFFTDIGLIFLITLLLTPITQTVFYHGAFQDMLGRPIRLGDSVTLGLRRFFPVLGTLICMGVTISFGFVLLIIPGFILAAMYAVSVPACVVEQEGPFRSLGRSAALTKGNRWRLIGIGAVVLAASLGVGVVVGLAQFAMGPMAGAVARFVANSVMGAFYSIVGAVAYHDLRVAKEGIGTDRIAAVFD